MRAWLGILLVVSGCVPPDHSNGINTLVRIEVEAPGDNCEDGGLAIHTGRDRNRNGVVDDSEIAATHYACNGSSGLSCEEGQGTATGVVVVQDASELAALDGVTCIDGDLIIAGYADASLPTLALETITGSITIAGNPNLSSLAGFEHLTRVGRTFSIQGNDAMSDLGAVGQLTDLGALIITGNDSLLDLAGLEVWTELKPNLTVSNNSSLASLDGLENVILATQSINIKANRSLTDLSALDGVKIIGVMDISGNIALPTISLAGLQKVNVTLTIGSNAALTSVSLPMLATASAVNVRSNPVLQTVDLDGLVVTNNLAFAANSELTDVSAPNLSAVTQRLDFSSLPMLASVGLGSLQTVGEALVVQQAPQLSSLAGFAALRKVSGDFTVRGLTALENFEGLTALEQISGNLLVQDNAQLTSFTGMQGSLSTIGGNLSILDNNQLPVPEAQAFANSVTVNGTVTID